MAAKHIGRRIHVYWVEETAWFSGTVREVSAAQGYFVQYDDGDERWEGVDEIYRFEGHASEEEDVNDGGESIEGDAEGGRQEYGGGGEFGASAHQEVATTARRRPGSMLEPPASDDEGEQSDERDDEVHDHDHDSDRDQQDSDAHADDERVARTGRYPPPVGVRDGDDGHTASEGEVDDDGSDHKWTRKLAAQSGGHSRDEDTEDTHSVVMTEVPTMYGVPSRSSSRDLQPTGSASITPRIMPVRSIPHRGTLAGVVLSATELPHVAQTDEEPRPFVRVAFVEAGGSSEDAHGGGGSSASHLLMLRCKQALAATRPAAASHNPIWNINETEPEEGDHDLPHDDGLFRLQVAPPVVSREPAWLQLKGDLLFSVYHSGDDASQRKNEFVGQASVALRRVMRDVFTQSAAFAHSVKLQLALLTRQGKPLGPDTELVVAFRFEPEFVPDRREAIEPSKAARTPPVSARASSRPPSVAPSKVSTTLPSRTKTSVKSVISGRDCGGSGGRGGGGRAGANPLHMSSSEVNRRRLEKRIEQENRAMMKRVAEQRSRGGSGAARRPAAKATASEAIKRGGAKAMFAAAAAADVTVSAHTATSRINRNKFLEQVERDNAAMGKRLATIVRGGAGGAGAKHVESKTVLAWDNPAAQDKAYVKDKRHIVRQEKHYLQEKAQAKYTEQSELVDDVMALQEHIAEWKARVFAAKASLNRVDVMNKKDTHVRDCLRSAAEKAKQHHPPTTSPSSTTAERLKLQGMLAFDDMDGGGDAAVRRHREEEKELVDEAETMVKERFKLDQELTALGARETQLEEEIVDQHRKMQFVRTKRVFHEKMAGMAPARAADSMQTKKLDWSLSMEEEEQWAIYKAQQELAQLQIGVSVLKDRLNNGASSLSRRLAASSSSSSTSSTSAACEYLRQKIEKRRTKIDQQESELRDWRRKCEALIVDGEYERHRRQVQELQHLLFLCQSEAKHVAAAERVAKHAKEQQDRAFEKQLFEEQNETEILFKSKKNAASQH